jgi:hypothetical protein
MNALKKPIFIVGAPRSGTTLLQYMLRSHPNISLPTGESHFFIPLFRNEEGFGDLTKQENIRAVLEAMYKQSADFLDTDIHGIQFNIDRLTKEFHAEGRVTMEAIFSGLFEKNAIGEGKTRWGDKTPYYVLHMKLLLEKFPDAQFIHLIRDGRDVAMSLLNRKHDFGVYNYFFAAKYWEIYVALGRECGQTLGDKTYHEVRYEDLLTSPETAMRGICKFLDEPYSDNLVNFKKSSESGKTPLLQKPIQKENQAKWRTKMSPKQIETFERAVSTTLLDFNYPLISTGKPIPLLAKAFWRAHNFATQKINLFTKLFKG